MTWQEVPWLEVFGYVGSVLVAISLMMSNIWKLRWINFFGAAVFSIYGLLVGAYPVFALNAFIALVDVYYIVEMMRKRDFFTVIELQKEDQMLIQFLKFHQLDILKYFPGFDIFSAYKFQAIFILRNMNPVGVFIYHPSGSGKIHVILDYVVPDFRDLKNAYYLFFHESDIFKSKGIQLFETETTIESHKKYLHAIGFSESPEKPGFFTRPV